MPPAVAWRNLSILLLAVAGGSVDAVVILGFGALVAAQTGNTVILAVSLAQGRFVAGFRSAISFAGYIVGAAVGGLIVVADRDSTPWPSAVGRGLAVELVPLVCLFIVWHLAGPNPIESTMLLLVSLAAVAMGIQSAAVLRLHAGPTTTYVTGTLTTFTTEAIRWLRLAEAAPASSPARHDLTLDSAGSALGPWLYGATWLAYALGALVGGLLFLRLGEVALLLPIVLIVAVVVAEARRS